MSKTSRQHLIVSLLEQHAVASQHQLVDLLDAEGVAATRATVSRDLNDLGAVKVRIAGGGTVYAIPEHSFDRITSEDSLRRVMGEWVASVAHSANIVVMRTPPGCAHVVASALDRAGMPEVLGTVAGDDTLLAIAAADTPGAHLANRLSELAGIKQ